MYKIIEGETFYPFGFQTGQPEVITKQMYEWWIEKHPEDKYKFELIESEPKATKKSK